MLGILAGRQSNPMSVCVWDACVLLSLWLTANDASHVFCKQAGQALNSEYIINTCSKKYLPVWDTTIERRRSLTYTHTMIMCRDDCSKCGVLQVFYDNLMHAVYLGAGGYLPNMASDSQHFAVCNTSSLLSLMVVCVFELMTTGSLSHPLNVLAIAIWKHCIQQLNCVLLIASTTVPCK